MYLRQTSGMKRGEADGGLEIVRGAAPMRWSRIYALMPDENVY